MLLLIIKMPISTKFIHTRWSGLMCQLALDAMKENTGIKTIDIK